MVDKTAIIAWSVHKKKKNVGKTSDSTQSEIPNVEYFKEGTHYGKLYYNCDFSGLSSSSD